MNSPTSRPEPGARLASARLVRGAAVAAVAVVAVVVAQVTGGREDGVSGEEATAWQSRVELERVMYDTAAAISLDVAAGESDSGTEICERPGGGRGESYIVTGPRGPAIEDLDGALEQIRVLWESEGWEVATRQIGAAKGLSTTVTDGGSLYILSGPGGTGFNGETVCARTDGAPTGSATSESEPTP